MKKLIIIIFIINIFIGQLLYSQIKSRETEVSKNLVINLYEKLRIQTIFLTFFYSKIDRAGDFELIFELESEVEKFKKAKRFYGSLSLPSELSVKYFDSLLWLTSGQIDSLQSKGNWLVRCSQLTLQKYRDIESFYCLAGILNKINLELINIFENPVTLNVKKLVDVAYDLFAIAMHQFPILINDKDKPFYEEVLGCLNSNMIDSIDLYYAIKISWFMFEQIDRILKSSLNLVLSLPYNNENLNLIRQIFLKNDFFNYISIDAFHSCFEKLFCIDAPQVEYFEFQPGDFDDDCSVKDFEELLLSDDEPSCNEIEYEYLFKELTILYNI
jgi:hypothetical protein